MSIYCYLACEDCKEALFVKDADTDVHASPRDLGQFLEKHTNHRLRYIWEDDYLPDGSSPDDITRFEAPERGRWSYGRFQND